ncbi:hypothetical protein GWI33_018274 [Rhynchophorus ferrugineus]|uniref:Uncharacterized protein n=1 Tax=Rhynchophorus ferrugineus TaxID=354439 RepID=A0A834HU40_RHYFE|nr:hypothetical protein GWI33_018274 [Rhynchophorus ferrugineus]
MFFIYLHALLIINYLCDQIQCRPLDADDGKIEYNFMYISPGARRNETIEINKVPNDLVVYGDYNYISSPVSGVQVKYVADSTGFHPIVHIYIYKLSFAAFGHQFDTKKGISSAAIATLSGGGLG